ncbi:M20/M25/M40 family metallo-hydrolase [Comamonas humi]
MGFRLNRCGAWLLALAATGALAMPPAAQPALYAAAERELAPFLGTLQQLVEIESGSLDIEGLQRMAAVAAERLRAEGGAVQVLEAGRIEPLADAPARVGPMVQAVFRGSGTAKIMLIAHMDTVYQRGDLARQPFRIDGDHAYGLGIVDDKQGVALIVHLLRLLREQGLQRYGQLTVLLNSDEEISSPGSRETITRLAQDQDAVLSLETGGRAGTLRLGTSGIGAAYLRVQGRAAHAGAEPAAGVNALYELSHQVMNMRDLSQPEAGLELNWTLATAGTRRNVIPDTAEAQADARATRVADFDRLERRMRQRIQNQLFEDSRVQLDFEVRRPPLEPSDAARRIAARAQRIALDELGQRLAVVDTAHGGGTDAAFAGLKARGGVVEGCGVPGYGAHSIHGEYLLVSSIVPRLYLVARMVMELSEEVKGQDSPVGGL